jgi:hypothetical protein
MIDSTLQLIAIQIWQISVLFAIVFGISLIPAMKRRPHFLFLLWVLFFVKCLVPPVVQSPVSLMSGLTPSKFQFSVVGDNRVSVSKFDGPYSGSNGFKLAGRKSDVGNAAGETEIASINWPNRLAFIWVGGSLIVLGGFVLNYFLVHRRIFVLSDS